MATITITYLMVLSSLLPTDSTPRGSASVRSRRKRKLSKVRKAPEEFTVLIDGEAKGDRICVQESHVTNTGETGYACNQEGGCTRLRFGLQEKCLFPRGK